MAITDNGPGIPPELTGRVFERFVRGDRARSRTTGSTGLGLSIVQVVIQAQGGEVEVASRPGRTVFAVRLPAHRSCDRIGSAGPSWAAVPQP
ncbi:ATP-binding protein [Kitasatospora sp. NPDC090091]|uniref:ATP-binding protein n=1 Tax=Kitasatospora sp. NPDC090091 TaxID=3364081 RepID=UPI0037F766D3